MQVDGLELPAVFAARVEAQAQAACSARCNGLAVKLERRASAAAAVGGDGHGPRGVVDEPHAQLGDLARVQASETDGIAPALFENCVRKRDFRARALCRGALCLFWCGVRTPRAGSARCGKRECEHRGQQPERGVCGACGHGSDQAAARLADAALLGQRGHDLVQHAVDEGAAARRRVVFRDFDPLVERHLDGNRREGDQLGHGRADDEVVHEDDALDVPVGRELLDVLLAGVVVDQRLLEERLHELRIVGALELRGDLQFRVRGAQRGERAQHHDEDVGQVVAPEQRHLLQRLVQRVALLQFVEEGLDEAAVVVQRAFVALHVLLVVVALGELRVERADQLGVLRPAQLARGYAVVDRIAVGNDADDGVVDEFRVRVEVFVCRQFLLLGQLLPLLRIACHRDGEDQQLEVEVVGLVDGGHQRLFRGHHVVGARLQVGEQGLDDLYAE